MGLLKTTYFSPRQAKYCENWILQRGNNKKHTRNALKKYACRIIPFLTRFKMEKNCQVQSWKIICSCSKLTQKPKIVFADFQLGGQ